MGRRLPLILLAALLLAAPAAGEDIQQEKEAVDAEISSLQEKIDAARARENELSAQIETVTSRIRALEAEVGDVTREVEALERDLALHEERLDRINALFRVQTSRLVFMRKQWEAATRRLNDRIVEIYKSDEPTELEVIFAARSFTEMLDQLDYVRSIGRQDQRIARQVARAKASVKRARAKTAKTRKQVEAATRVVQVRANQVRAVRDELVTSQQELEGARAEKRETLTDVQETKEEYLEEVEGLLAVSNELAAKIRAAQAGPPSAPVPTGSPSAAGFLWPCSGPLTSPFGWRWGRIHEGIDLGCPYGAPVVASAAGTIIHSGWLGGYGNLVVIDHGNGIATAYGHNSSIAVTYGQAVGQGQVIAYVGSTGHSTGPHCHFEVRVGGSAVDPLGYL
jgi:murein DD-endopeptidase MepM/ murein hydrolase activator NlpD